MPSWPLPTISKMSPTLSLPFPRSSASSLYLPRRHRILKPSSSQLSVDSPPSDRPTQTNQSGAIIVGAGLAGLAAATSLASSNTPFVILDSADAVGGHVRTDTLDGFLLDRGFQIFITAYPEAQKILNYQTLDLNRFYSGACVYYGGRFHTVADPLRHLADSLLSLTNPIGSLLDKALIALTRIRVLSKSDGGIFFDKEIPTVDLLRNTGFSEDIVDRFFRPFFGGIFFDKELETSSRMFDFIFKCLALGDNTLPAKGISAIPEQLASRLPPESIRLNSRVNSIGFKSVTLENGEVLTSDFGIILAVEEPEAIRLLAGKPNSQPVQKPARSTVCLYYSTDQDRVPVQDPILFLNGSGKGIVNNMFFATNVAKSYGPPGKALVSVSLIGSYDDVADGDLADRVVRELSGWFGEEVVGSWSHLRTYRVRYAQPNQRPPTDQMKDPRVEQGLYRCGDYLTSATFDGALVSGRKAAEALLRDIALIKV